jgi:hypothetical protein
MSGYEMQGLLLRLGRTVNSATRWRGAELARLTPEVGQQVNDLLAEAGGRASLFLRTDLSPWTGATLTDGEAVQRAQWKRWESGLERRILQGTSLGSWLHWP